MEIHRRATRHGARQTCFAHNETVEYRRSPAPMLSWKILQAGPVPSSCLMSWSRGIFGLSRTHHRESQRSSGTLCRWAQITARLEHLSFSHTTTLTISKLGLTLAQLTAPEPRTSSGRFSPSSRLVSSHAVSSCVPPFATSDASATAHRTLGTWSRTPFSPFPRKTWAAPPHHHGVAEKKAPHQPAPAVLDREEDRRQPVGETRLSASPCIGKAPSTAA